ncbi:MAG: NUDIX hydrolase [bacterium]|nr:NUDIX hydrolase [bacterium]
MTKHKTILGTEWFTVESEPIVGNETADKQPFYRITISDSILIAAFTTAGEIILVRQYRQANRLHTLEFPAGYIDTGESPEQAATRELYEETGYVCGKVNFLGMGLPWISRVKGQAFLFYGQDAVKDQDFEPKENIEVILLSLNKLEQLSVKGEFEQMQGLGLLLLAKWKFGLEI